MSRVDQRHCGCFVTRYGRPGRQQTVHRALWAGCFELAGKSQVSCNSRCCNPKAAGISSMVRWLLPAGPTRQQPVSALGRMMEMYQQSPDIPAGQPPPSTGPCGESWSSEPENTFWTRRKCPGKCMWQPSRARPTGCFHRACMQAATRSARQLGPVPVPVRVGHPATASCCSVSGTSQSSGQGFRACAIFVIPTLCC